MLRSPVAIGPAAREHRISQIVSSPITKYPEYTKQVQERHKTSQELRQKLRALRLQYMLLYPARLKVLFQGKALFSDHPEEVLGLVGHAKGVLFLPNERGSRSRGLFCDGGGGETPMQHLMIPIWYPACSPQVTIHEAGMMQVQTIEEHSQSRSAKLLAPDPEMPEESVEMIDTQFNIIPDTIVPVGDETER
ncbi:hypothetical protein NDU88_002049 [Pleurodeles waltl]|uniref:Uncharacterized protein n=1 Tax=Pleurodeles waltl TaxID=8319 RepID=A0AAV7LN87_PLEWA|nr:hypothetical protein NDU88_002049 [Pleurodeles waltl]